MATYLLCWLNDATVSVELERVLLSNNVWMLHQLLNAILGYGLSSFHSQKPLSRSLMRRLLDGEVFFNLENCSFFRIRSESELESLVSTCTGIAYAQQERTPEIQHILECAKEIDLLEEDEDVLFCDPCQVPIAEGDISYYAHIVYRSVFD